MFKGAFLGQNGGIFPVLSSLYESTLTLIHILNWKTTLYTCFNIVSLII